MPTTSLLGMVATLDDVVPSGRVYRHLEHPLDLAFVRDLVGEA